MASALDFVTSVVRALVDQPEQVQSRMAEGPRGSFIELTVPASERGKVIGRRGRTIQSLRTLATAAFGESGQPVGVELFEEGRTRPNEGSEAPAEETAPASAQTPQEDTPSA